MGEGQSPLQNIFRKITKLTTEKSARQDLITKKKKSDANFQLCNLEEKKNLYIADHHCPNIKLSVEELRQKIPENKSNKYPSLKVEKNISSFILPPPCEIHAILSHQNDCSSCI